MVSINSKLARKPSNRLVVTLPMLYQILAISIRIQGLQNRPLRNQKNYRPLRNALEEARTHLIQRFPDVKSYSKRKFNVLISIPIFTAEYYEDISTCFQGIVQSLGDSVAGDEKLFHFTGQSIDIRLVLSKPDRIGLWFYELCSPLSYGGSYLLWTKLHHCDPSIAQSIPTSQVVKSWSDVVKKLGQPETILTMDSYYLDRAGKKILADSGVKYIAAITKSRFEPFFNVTEPKINKPGQWTGLHNRLTSETVVLHWSNDSNVGKKMVFTNIMKILKGRVRKEMVPVYDLYKLTFKACDIFNKNLCDCTWPHKKGGRNCPGDLGVHHDFVLSATLQNVFNCYSELCRRHVEDLDFRQLCVELADELFQYSSTIV